MIAVKRVLQKFFEYPLGLFWTVIVAFIYTPVFILYVNAKSEERITLLSFVILLVICLSTILLSYIVQRIFPKVGIVFDRIMSGIALYLLITTFFFPVHRGILDGRIAEISTSDMVLHLILLGACLVLAIISLCMVKIDILQRKVVTIWGGFALLAGICMGISILPLSQNGGSVDEQWQSAAALSPRQNIIIISLDMVQQDFAKPYFDESEAVRNRFSGFVFFTNTASASPFTALSMSAMLRGNIFEGNAYDMDPQDNLLYDLSCRRYEISTPSMLPSPVKEIKHFPDVARYDSSMLSG